MTTTLFFVSAGAALLLLLLWWWWREARPAPPGRLRKMVLEDVSRLHSERFPQLRQVLHGADEAFVRQRASGERLRRWRQERRAVLLGYLRGLREDHRRLLGLARALARLSARVRQRQELGLLGQAARFQWLYLAVWFRIRTGWKPEQALVRLAERIGSLAREIEAGMADLEPAEDAGLIH